MFVALRVQFQCYLIEIINSTDQANVSIDVNIDVIFKFIKQFEVKVTKLTRSLRF